MSRAALKTRGLFAAMAVLILSACDKPPSHTGASEVPVTAEVASAPAPGIAPIEYPTDGAEAGPITLRQFAKIQPGMSMGDVKAILRRTGKQEGAQSIDGATVQVYSFATPTGNDALIFFADGKVIRANPPLDMKADDLK